VHELAFWFMPILGFGFLGGSLGFGLVLYFLPAIVAFARSRRDTRRILLLNFLLGWTAIGWVVALVWALKQDTRMAIR